MTAERITSALMSADRIGAIQSEHGISREEAVRRHILDVNANTIAGHDIYSEKNDEWVLVRDGLLRSLNLERDVKGYFYRERAKEDSQELDFSDSNRIHPDEWFSFDNLVHDYKLVREKHNEMFSKHEGETKASMPHVNRELAHTFLKELVAEGRLIHDSSRSLEDIELHSAEGVQMFRFPPSEYIREVGDLEKERDKLKNEATELAIGIANQRAIITGNPQDKWMRATEPVGVFVGLKKNSPFNGKMGMFWSDTSAEAFLREKVENEGWESMNVKNPVTDRYETYYRPLPRGDKE